MRIVELWHQYQFQHILGRKGGWLGLGGVGYFNNTFMYSDLVVIN